MAEDTVDEWIRENVKSEEDLENMDLLVNTFLAKAPEDFFKNGAKLENMPEAYGLLAEVLIFAHSEREKTMEQRCVHVKRRCGQSPGGRPCYLVTYEKTWFKKGSPRHPDEVSMGE